ncbi:Lrp/AsnC family transcriptional regulator [Streptomyces sp. NBC_00385]|uniref:Lrp/AsnC family transcriptional regulator n=1 Tax=Streptomyces sp. NBC_00385 TaxID=2975733 RepID=UPI002DDAF110|nr:Lrp/AsnC family transcriptional regulator [Streptomyces sp. NBC_00385]WRZ03037.1 Lrp/AsnC family transcriptional regulator [Streptomyces sp. NBC_00385]
MVETGGGNETPLDAADLGILEYLARRPRASFAEVGERVGLHERTVARRLGRLLDTGEVRFIADLPTEYLGEGMVVELAVRCAPGRLEEVARAVAARRDARSVEVATGDLLVLAEMTVADEADLIDLVDRAVGRMPGVLDIHSAVVLRLLLTAADWAPYDPEPSPLRQLAIEGAQPPPPIAVDAFDRELVHLLGEDARMPMSTLAARLRMSESTVRRRLNRLMASHVFHLRLFAEPALLGYPVETRFQLEVRHAHLGAALRRLAREPSIRHLVVTTGRSNVLGYASHATTAEMYDFHARAFAGLTGLREVRTALLMRTYRRAGRPVGEGRPFTARPFRRPAV